MFNETIMNYKTVASFGHQNRIVDHCRSLLDMLVKSSPRKGFITGIVSGFSVFITNNAFSANFWIASVLIDKYKNKSHPLDTEDVFVALMCVLVGGFGAGQAMLYGPQTFAAMRSAV